MSVLHTQVLQHKIIYLMLEISVAFLATKAHKALLQSESVLQAVPEELKFGKKNLLCASSSFI